MKPKLISDCYRSFRAMPAPVQFWVAAVLVPVNMASLLFLAEPMGPVIAFLATVAILANLLVMLADRGFSRKMALPHLLPWSILVVLLIFARPQGSALHDAYLWALMATDAVSLAFDFPDALRWWRGDRAVMHP